jgi:RNA-binding proteins (RRM domain)
MESFMATSIYVGNLSWSATQDSVESLFTSFGQVISVNLISDRETGRARGFGFVEMEDGDAVNAISALDGKEVDGRNLRVNKAEPKKPAVRRW